MKRLILLTTLLLLIVGGCENPVDREVIPVPEESLNVMQAAPNENAALRAVMAVQDYHTPWLMDLPGVVGTGIGKDKEGNLVISVYTENDEVVGIPPKLDLIPVRKRVTGRFVAYADPKTRFDRPVPIGVSTGHPDITAGTIGCRVKDDQGNVYALSNNHVFANSNKASIGDNILQPGPYDGGQDPADAIGTLYAYKEIFMNNGENNPNFIDAAIAEIDITTVGYETPSDGYGAPSKTIHTVTTADLDEENPLEVRKYGRTTGNTTGFVVEVNVTVTVCYQARGPFCREWATFYDQIAFNDGVIEYDENGNELPDKFSAGGDSGSLIVTGTGNHPIALLFAGSSTRTIGSPIQYVLDAFDVTIDDGSGLTADFSFTTTDLDVAFTDQSTGEDITNRDWKFGDGNTGSGVTPTHKYLKGGTYTVTLTVDDGASTSASTSKDVTVVNPNNIHPVADFTYSATELAVDFDANGSSDQDGTISSYSWAFGDGSTGSGATASHTYATAGTYSVILTVTDDEGDKNSTSQDVTVSSPTTGNYDLIIDRSYRIKGVHTVDLSWSGVDNINIAIYRDGSFICGNSTQTPFTDNIGNKGGATYTYEMFEFKDNKPVGDPLDVEIVIF